MSVYEWARQELRRSQDAAQEIGFDPGLTLRAMLSAVVQQSKGVRSFEDLADELQYLAENLDDQQEYALCGLSGAAAGLRKTVRLRRQGPRESCVLQRPRHPGR